MREVNKMIQFHNGMQVLGTPLYHIHCCVDSCELVCNLLGQSDRDIDKKSWDEAASQINPHETQKIFAIRLESEAEEIYAKAIEALESSDEVRAQKLLLERYNVQEKLKEVLKTCATA